MTFVIHEVMTRPVPFLLKYLKHIFFYVAVHYGLPDAFRQTSRLAEYNVRKFARRYYQNPKNQPIGMFHFQLSSFCTDGQIFAFSNISFEVAITVCTQTIGLIDQKDISDINISNI